MSARYRWVTDCVSCPSEDVPALGELVSRARPVTLATFRRIIGAATLREWAAAMGYERRPGLPLSADWHVGYYTSRWKGKRAAFIVHSAIEHVWERAS